MDDLLWHVLWKPLDLPPNARESFKLEGECLELVAKVKGKLAGGLVANWTSPKEVEIRHIAVSAEAQNQGIGTKLVRQLISTVSQQGCSRIHTIARSTSVGFFEHLGFGPAPGRAPEHPVFRRHGIAFELMERNVEQGAAPDRSSASAA